MGGVCSGRAKSKNAKVVDKNSSSAVPRKKIKSVKSLSRSKENAGGPVFGRTTVATAHQQQQQQQQQQRHNSGELLPSLSFSISRELKPSTPAKAVPVKAGQKSSFLGKAGTVGLEKAVEVLDTLGSSMSNLNARNGFITGMASRGNRISILAFEVANTISKGASLFQSLSEDNVQLLKEEILHSEGVQLLVSTDIKELLIIAAADKREEFDVLSREVIRFGDLCKDPQWHNLGRYFAKLDSEYSTDKQLRAEAETTMKELTTLVQHTSELYHELNALDRFEQDYQRKLEEMDSANLPRRGESLTILQSELKEQRKLVRSLKKRSLWSKNLEEIMENLVDIITYLHQAIFDAFGNNGSTLTGEDPVKNPHRLGPAGLALHYANIINQIDNMASRPTSLPPNIRDTLYHGLPISVKKALRSRLQTVDVKEELTITQIKAEMEKTLQWLVPIATNTTKAHQGFGWVGDWANTGNEFGKNSCTASNLIRIQTLYHADKQKTDQYILELVTWLHRLINLVRSRDYGFKAMPVRLPSSRGAVSHTKVRRLSSLKYYSIQLSKEDRDMLDKVSWRRLIPRRSRSQEFDMGRRTRTSKVGSLSRSAGSSPVRESSRRQGLKHPKANFLDVMDGLDSSTF